MPSKPEYEYILDDNGFIIGLKRKGEHVRKPFSKRPTEHKAINNIDKSKGKRDET